MVVTYPLFSYIYLFDSHLLLLYFFSFINSWFCVNYISDIYSMVEVFCYEDHVQSFQSQPQKDAKVLPEILQEVSSNDIKS